METVTIPKKEYTRLKAAYEKQQLLVFLEQRAAEAQENIKTKAYTIEDLGF